MTEPTEDPQIAIVLDWAEGLWMSERRLDDRREAARLLAALDAHAPPTTDEEVERVAAAILSALHEPALKPEGTSIASNVLRDRFLGVARAAIGALRGGK